MKFLTKVIAILATGVVNEILNAKEKEIALGRMHDFCEKNGLSVTEVMHRDPVRFMNTFDKAASGGETVKIEYRDFPVEYDRSGRKARTDWIQCENKITVHSGAWGF